MTKPTRPDQTVDLRPAIEREPMPALTPRRCNWCNVKLTGRQRKLCGDPECHRKWESFIRTTGRTLAEPVMYWTKNRNKRVTDRDGKPTQTETTKRAFREISQIGVEARDRIEEMQRANSWRDD